MTKEEQTKFKEWLKNKAIIDLHQMTALIRKEYSKRKNKTNE